MFNFLETDGRIGLNLEYNTDIYAESLIVQLAEHFIKMLSAILLDPLCAVGEMDYFRPEEKMLLREGYNTANHYYNKDLTVVDLFKKQAAATPDNIALIHETKSVTYQKLDEVSDRLASWLILTAEVKTDDLVAIIMDRSEWLVIVMMGILKTGAAYIPIDPGYPTDRIDYMITNSKCKLTITDALVDKWQQDQTIMTQR